MNTIFLIGFMGSGKSTIGSLLSATYDLTFVDTDVLIEQTTGQKIPDIFKMSGETVFRDYESSALKDVSGYDVVATGGGIVERSSNIKKMKKHGTIVYLQTSFSEIEKRLIHSASRPLWKNNDRNGKIDLFNRRHRLYKQSADKTILTDDRNAEEIVDEIANKFSFNRPR